MRLRSLQILVLALLVAAWYVLTAPGLVPPTMLNWPARMRTPCCTLPRTASSASAEASCASI